jgi:hypothetical protein
VNKFYELEEREWTQLLAACPALHQLHFTETSGFMTEKQWLSPPSMKDRKWSAITLHGTGIGSSSLFVDWHVFWRPSLHTIDVVLPDFSVDTKTLDKMHAACPNLLHINLRTEFKRNGDSDCDDDLARWFLEKYPLLQSLRLGRRSSLILHSQELVLQMYKTWKWMTTFPGGDTWQFDPDMSYDVFCAEMPRDQLDYLLGPWPEWSWTLEQWVAFVMTTSTKWHVLDFCSPFLGSDQFSDAKAPIMLLQRLPHLKTLTFNQPIRVSAELLEALAQSVCRTLRVGDVFELEEDIVLPEDNTIKVEHLLACGDSGYLKTLRIATVLTNITPANVSTLLQTWGNQWPDYPSRTLTFFVRPMDMTTIVQASARATLSVQEVGLKMLRIDITWSS